MQKSCHAFRSMTGHGKNLFKVWGTIIVMDLNSWEKKKSHFFPPSFTAVSLSSSTAENPPSPPAKESGTRSELHKSTLKHMFLAWVRGFFPLEFVQESDLLSCFQSLDMVKVWRDWSGFPSPEADWYRGRRESLLSLCGSNFRWSCHSEGPELEENVLCSCLCLIRRLFPAVFSWLSWVWKEHPKYLSRIQTLVFSFGAFFQFYSLGNHIRLLPPKGQILMKVLQAKRPLLFDDGLSWVCLNQTGEKSTISFFCWSNLTSGKLLVTDITADALSVLTKEMQLLWLHRLGDRLSML